MRGSCHVEPDPHPESDCASQRTGPAVELHRAAGASLASSRTAPKARESGETATKLLSLNDAAMEELVRVPSGKRIRIERKLVEKAREYLGDEEVLQVFRGQTAVSPVFLPLIGQLLFSVKPRTVMVTERSVLTLQQSRWSQ